MYHEIMEYLICMFLVFFVNEEQAYSDSLMSFFNIESIFRKFYKWMFHQNV